MFSPEYCPHCGARNERPNAVICARCGKSLGAYSWDKYTESTSGGRIKRDETAVLWVKIFLVIGCVLGALLFLFPLLWRIPITVYVFRRFQDQRPINLSIKICVLLFASTVGGIIRCA